MKRLYKAIIWAIIAIASLPATAQEQNEQQQRRSPQARTGAREPEKKNNGLPELSVRAQELNERLSQEVGEARWTRVIYRKLDLNDEQNAPLYYPPRAINGTMNLFSTIFGLLVDNKIQAYRYEDGFEAFDEDHLLNLKEFFEVAHIYYEEIPGKAGAAPSFTINESDIPSEEVKTYYIKEAWYFDQNNSVFEVKTLALCPIITTSGDLGENETTPLFWLPYENIRPYISNSLIMTSNVNNAKTFTLDDYFSRRMFKGEIIKTENLMNKTLQQLYPDPDSLSIAQAKIEAQLDTFRQSLYVKTDSSLITAKDSQKAEKQASKSTKRTSVKPSAKAPTPPKAERAAPVRSVRRK